MSDKASIFVRYNFRDDKNNLNFKGFIGNHYRGFDPYGMISRALCGMIFFSKNAPYIRSISEMSERDLDFQKYRRSFDVDFFRCNIQVSYDSTSEVRKKWSEENYKVHKEEIVSDFFWCDTDFGQLLIDIYGDKNNPTIKYAYVNNAYGREAILDVDSYRRRYNLGNTPFDEDEKMDDIVIAFKEMATLMTSEEVEEFCSESAIEYLFSKEIEEEIRQQRIEEEIRNFVGPRPHYIEDLGLSVRAYNCLRRAKIRTVEELRTMSVDDLIKVRNLGRRCVNEILEILADEDNWM